MADTPTTPTVVTVEAMRDYLRIDGTANDKLLSDYIDAATVYVTRTTGATAEQQAANPLARAAVKMLVAEWYDPQGIDATASDRAVTEMLKHITGGENNG